MRFDKDPGRVSEKWKRNTAPRPNLLINGDFQVAQRGAGPFTSTTSPANNDDTYLLDQWNYLAAAANVCNVSQDSTDVPTTAAFCMLMTVVTANNKFGAVNFVESAVAAPILNETVSLQFKAKVTGSSISNIRAAVISWQGTADTITSDVVSAWNAAGNDPTLVANWTYESTPTNLAITTSWQTFKIENVAIDTASTHNIGVFIWIDDTDATAADALRIADVKLEAGNACTDLVHRLPAEEIYIARRFFFQIQNGTASVNGTVFACGVAISTTDIFCPFILPTEMRVTPTFTTDTVSRFDLQDGGSTHTATNISFNTSSPSKTAGLMAAATAAGLTAGRAVVIISNTNSAWMRFSCEL